LYGEKHFRVYGNASHPTRVNLTQNVTGISVTFWDIASGLAYLILIPLAITILIQKGSERWQKNP